MKAKNTASTYFTKATFHFLTELSRHNEREWFNDNKLRCEDCVRGSALAFIEDIAPELQLIAPRFLATPKKVGGMRLGENFMKVFFDYTYKLIIFPLAHPPPAMLQT